MKNKLNEYRAHLTDRSYTFSALVGALMLLVSFLINYQAVSYAARSASAGTTDILLDNLPVVNTDLIFSEGALLFILFITVLSFLKPKTIPFTLKSISLFVIIRSFFVVMTHYGPYVHRIAVDFDAMRYISSGADLFFSGHTGMPFLMALLYWDNKLLRYLFLISSVGAAVAVILGHLHYTIDVFSAYFITYGIMKIAEKLFPADRTLFLSAHPEGKW